MRKHFMMITKEAGGKGEEEEEGKGSEVCWLLCHPRQAVELPGHHTEIFLRQFCLSCCLAFSCVVTFRRGKCREREGERVGGGGKGETTAACNAWLRCLPTQQVAEVERERERAGNFLQTSCENTRNRKLLRKTLNAMLVRPSACPPVRVSVRRLQLQLSFSIRACPSAHSSQFSALRVLSSQFARPFVSVCLSACLVHPSVCLSQSQSQPQSPALSLSSSVSV